jgi:hypothetical protein
MLSSITNKSCGRFIGVDMCNFLAHVDRGNSLALLLTNIKRNTKTKLINLVLKFLHFPSIDEVMMVSEIYCCRDFSYFLPYPYYS